MKPLAIDLCCGLGGWTEGLLAEGWDVVGFDIERHKYGQHQYPAQLVLQDVLTLTGEQFRGKAALIVASPPCQKYSYMAMPWTRAKALQAWYRDSAHPERIVELNAIFDACVRIGKEAQCPIVVENVRGAQPWVGRARWMYGSFALWGDVPALMPFARMPKLPGHSMNKGAPKWNMHHSESVATLGAKNDGTKNNGGSWFNVGSPGQKAVAQNPVHEGVKNGGDWFGSGPDCSLQRRFSGTKQSGISGPRDNGKGDRWFQDGAAQHGSKSSARKAASAMIAKIPEPLSRWIGATYFPREQSRAA